MAPSIENAPEYMSLQDFTYSKEPTVTSTRTYSEPLDAAYIGEPKKKVLHSSLWLWGSRLLVQLFPLVISGTIFYLNSKNVYWFDGGTFNNTWHVDYLGGLIDFQMAPATALNLLQLVAKIHELLAVGAMAAAILHMIRHMLAGNHSLPFGLLTSPYQVGSLGYICSKSFWTFLEWRHWLFGLLFLVYSILAWLIGPASAIGLIPTQPKFWFVPTPFVKLPQDPLYIIGSPDDLWPTHLTLLDVYGNRVACYDPHYQFSISGNSSLPCPAGGRYEMDPWVQAWTSEGIGTNLTMSEPLSGTQRVLTAHLIGGTTTSGRTVTSTLMMSVMNAVGTFWNYVRRIDVGIASETLRPMFTSPVDSKFMQPIVKVECSFWDYDAAREEHPSAGVPSFDAAFGQKDHSNSVPVPDEYWNFERPMDAVNFTWVDITHLKFDGKPLNLSIGAFVTVPYIIGNGPDIQQKSILMPCMVDARWIHGSVQYDPTSSGLIVNNITKSGDIAWDPARLSSQISIHESWADALNLRNAFGDDLSLMEHYMNDFVARGTSSNGTNFSNFYIPGYQYSGNNGIDTTNIVSTILGMAITDGMARVSYGLTPFIVYGRNKSGKLRASALNFQSGQYRGTNGTISESYLRENATAAHLQVYRWGFGYGGITPTLTFAFSVLCLHFALTIVYVIYLIVDRFRYHNYSVSSWGSMQEMTALALQSRPSALFNNTGAGVKYRKTWGSQVSIREVYHDKLELVFGQDRHTGAKPRRDVEYG